MPRDCADEPHAIQGKADCLAALHSAAALLATAWTAHDIAAALIVGLAVGLANLELPLAGGTGGMAAFSSTILQTLTETRNPWSL